MFGEGAGIAHKHIHHPRGAESTALTSLPLTVLDLSDEHAETLSFWGIHLFGMLAALPEKDLISRLGQEGRRLRQFALGGEPHLFRPLERVAHRRDALWQMEHAGKTKGLLFSQRSNLLQKEAQVQPRPTNGRRTSG